MKKYTLQFLRLTLNTFFNCQGIAQVTRLGTGLTHSCETGSKTMMVRQVRQWCPVMSIYFLHCTLFQNERRIPRALLRILTVNCRTIVICAWCKFLSLAMLSWMLVNTKSFILNAIGSFVISSKRFQVELF